MRNFETYNYYSWVNQFTYHQYANLKIRHNAGYRGETIMSEREYQQYYQQQNALMWAEFRGAGGF